MFPLKSLGLVLAAYIYAVAARRSLSNLYDRCDFTVDHSRYNLCPLFHDRGQDGAVRIHAGLEPDTHLEITFGDPVRLWSGEEDEPQVRTGDYSASRKKVD